MEQAAPIIKTFHPGKDSVIKTIEDDNGTLMIIDHAISDDAEDRDGDVIPLDAWKTQNFLHNPVVLDAHDHMAPPVGKCLKLYTEAGQLRAETQFAPTERGKMYFELYKQGFMRGFSVGLIPLELEPRGEKGHLIKSCELLEYSCVAVPANPRALKSALEKMQETALKKRGAVLSKSNLDKLRQMQQLLAEVLDTAETEPPDTEEPEGEPDNPDTLEHILLGALTKEQEEV